MFIQLKYTLSKQPASTAASVSATRLQWVDHARGLAIILVVYRHVIVGMKRSGLPVSELMYDLQELVYNFRMPVFFILSGIFITGSLKKKNSLSVGKDRVATILYPYVVWGTATILLQLLFSDFANAKREWTDLFNLFLDPRGVDHLWYLLALFNTNILYLILHKLIRNPWIHGLLAMIMYYVSRMTLMDGNSFVADMFYFYIYLFIGTVVSPWLLDKEKREKLLKFSNLLWLLPLVLAGQWFWFSFWNDGYEQFKKDERVYLFLFLVINLLACYFMYVISYGISSYKSFNWLAYLGKHSLYIYILHVFVASGIRNVILRVSPDLNVWLVAFICWSGALVIPVILFQLLKPFGFEKLFSLKRTAQ